MAARIGPSELSTLLILLCVIVVPIAAIAFARSGRALENLGKGTFGIDREVPDSSGPSGAGPAESKAEQEAEVRQMVEAWAFRRQRRGEGAIDVEFEIDRLLGLEQSTGQGAGRDDGAAAGLEGGADGVRAEIRELVIANNERRERRGEEPLDVEAEVERRFRDWT